MLELEPGEIKVGTPLGALDTPCLVVDLDRMERNLREWQETVAAAGNKLRPHVELQGLTTFRGCQFDGSGDMTPEECGLQEGRLMVELAENLRSRGIPVREVSAGSTPTGRHVARVPGVTEVRAGTYVFNDL